jgi:hypothetical protein
VAQFTAVIAEVVAMSASDEFNWREVDDNECIIVRHQPAIAVYLNPHGGVVIRQEGHYGPDEDQCIFITRDNVPTLTHALLEAAGFETADTFGEPLVLPKSEPLSAAERQRRYRNKKRDGNGDATVTVRDAECDESDELSLRLVAAE